MIMELILLLKKLLGLILLVDNLASGLKLLKQENQSTENIIGIENHFKYELDHVKGF